MSKIQFQYDIQNLTPANAQPVEANFTRIEQHVNQEVVERDGSVGMRAQLKLVGDPVAALDAAPKQYVDQTLPIGIIMMWGAAAPPANGRWLLCDGLPVQTASYPELFAVIGYTWGGSGGTFNTPPLAGKFPVGTDATRAIGATGGSADSSLPAHTHTANHDHGGGSTNSVDLNHLHAVEDHLHHPPAITVAAHNHGPGQGPAYVTYSPGSGQAIAWGEGPEIATPGATDNATPTASAGMTGAADRPLDTGWMDRSNAHSHTATVPAWNGSTSQAGVAPAGTNMPPYVSVPYIIRCK